MRTLGITISLIVLLGCGGAGRSYRIAPAPPAPPEAPGASVFSAVASDEAMSAVESAPSPSPQSSRGGSMAKVKKASAGIPQQAGEASKHAEQRADAEADDRLAVYKGYLRLRIRRLLEAVDRATEIVRAAEGYVEQISGPLVVARVPKRQFEPVMKALAAIGEVLDRKIEALDVTAQFTDMQVRLQVVQQTRERLLQLLEMTQRIDERLAILQEIKRVTEELERLEANLAALSELVTYSTVVLQLVPVRATGAAGQGPRSPFAWIHGLQPAVRTLGAGGGDKDAFELQAPKGFVLFERAETWTAEAADNSVIRVGVVSNEPVGDRDFWVKAVAFEMSGRDVERIDQGEAGGIAWQIFAPDEEAPFHYMIGLHQDGELVYVVEAFFPTQAGFERYREDVLEALRGFRVK